ncbi:MAG TPA: carboxylesterase family protein [Gammaproteobacteria bacterium]|nr:carboxylesterase family protein [Gammaproteobacteria bacterium]
MTAGRRTPRLLIDRRAFIGSGVAAAGLAAAGPFRRAFAQDVRGAKPTQAVETAAGRVQGVVLDGGVNAFYGVPYAASTAGANRFMPPQKLEAWTGVRAANAVGHRSPQDFEGPISEVYSLDRREPMGEDCLNLNVFTPALGAGNRPVMVWLHGGGYSSGSGNWLLYDGARLARSQDVVVVPVTHRLNVFGYLYLAGLGGEKYAQSSNVGMLDIVAALEWVRDNIAKFGGDPGNVTIFGQSGGGGKVTALMGMPPAKGLFHRAIAMSGATLQGVSKDAATETAQKFMAAVGAKTVDQMQQMAMEKLRDVMASAQGLRLSPVEDGTTLPAGPFAPRASDLSADVPLIVSTVAQEVNFFPTTPLDPMDDAALLANVKRQTGADDAAAKELIDVYRSGRPKAPNEELYQTIASDAGFRQGPLTVAQRKAEQGKAPVYMYYFTWQSPVREGKLRAYHTLDIPFAFNNVEVAASMTGAGNDRYALATKMSSAFAAFARTGNPACDELPAWPAFDMTQRATMVLDDDCRVENDPHKAERLAIEKVRGGRNGARPS